MHEAYLSRVLDSWECYRVNAFRSSLIWDWRKLVDKYFSFLTPQVGYTWASLYLLRDPQCSWVKFHSVATCTLSHLFFSFPSQSHCSSINAPKDHLPVQRFSCLIELQFPVALKMPEHRDNSPYYHAIASPLLLYLNMPWNVMFKICMVRSELSIITLIHHRKLLCILSAKWIFMASFSPLTNIHWTMTVFPHLTGPCCGHVNN